MTREDLQRIEAELRPLVLREGASASAQELAVTFNENLGDVRDALLEPARDLLGKGAATRDLAACLRKAVAELAFWRRVLLKMYRNAFASAETSSDFLVRYLLS